MTDQPNQKIPADRLQLDLAQILSKSEAIARCREALETDDMLSVAPRDDWAALLSMAEESASGLIASLPVLVAATEVAKAWQTPALEAAVEKLVKAVEGKP